MEAKHLKDIRPYKLIESKNNVFELVFNPQFKKAKDKYSIFTESVQSITLSDPMELRLYINFIDADVDNTTIYDEFSKIFTTISKLELKIADREGNIIETKEYNGKFVWCMPTRFSYGYQEFMTIFELDRNKL